MAKGLLYADISAGFLSDGSAKRGQESTTSIRVRQLCEYVVTSIK